ncbi:hypothetical protein ACN4GL_01560, partial [Burkholderia pseudomallei]
MKGEGSVARRVALYCAAGAVAAGAVWYVVGAPAKRDAGASPAFLMRRHRIRIVRIRGPGR